MNIDLNKTCDCGAELTFDSEIDDNEREYMPTVGEHLYKTVCPNCGEHLQYRESDVIEKRFYVYGSGPAESSLLRSAEHDDEAMVYAMSMGLEFDGPDDWAVEVTATRTAINDATRYDSNVVGWKEVVD